MLGPATRQLVRSLDTPISANVLATDKPSPTMCVNGDIPLVGGDDMGRMTAEEAGNLARLVAGLRPDWNSQAVHAAVQRAMSDHGRTRTGEVIAAAMLFLVADRYEDNPLKLTEAGPHWDAARGFLVHDTEGRTFSNLASRVEITAARDARAKAATPAARGRFMAEAREKLDALRSSNLAG